MRKERNVSVRWGGISLPAGSGMRPSSDRWLFRLVGICLPVWSGPVLILGRIAQRAPAVKRTQKQNGFFCLDLIGMP